MDGLRRYLGDSRLLPGCSLVFAFDSDGVTGGWIANNLGAIDFAAVEPRFINAGAAVAHWHSYWQAHRLRQDAVPSAQPAVRDARCWTAVWSGWFGFNAGSALAANGTAAVAFLNTVVATAASMLAWLLVEKIRDGHATSLGAASGVVAGLVAITPACAAVNIVGAIANRCRRRCPSAQWQ